jgi:iron complex transport system substrate-binding protein
MGPLMRVVSLLPAATEIVASLGKLDTLVGVSHECDYPAEVNDRPRITHCPIHGAGLASGDIDRWVAETLTSKGTLYTLDEARLRELRPEIILTQRLCDVCAVDYGSVQAFASTLPGPPQVVNLEPNSLAGIFENIQQVGRVLDASERARIVVAGLTERVQWIKARVSEAKHRPRCFLMEWIDPPYCSGHWGPELVEIAGGIEPLGLKGKDSVRIPWERVVEAQPEVIVLACCGNDVTRTLADLPTLARYPRWDDLPAVRSGRVLAVNGSAYFSRPGPRVVDSLEILAEILHPDLFRGAFPDRGATPAIQAGAKAS